MTLNWHISKWERVWETNRVLWHGNTLGDGIYWNFIQQPFHVHWTCAQGIYCFIRKTVKVKKNGLFLWHNYEEENNIKKLKNNKNNKIRKAQTSVPINLNIWRTNLIIDNKTCQTYHLMRRLRGQQNTLTFSEPEKRQSNPSTQMSYWGPR